MNFSMNASDFLNWVRTQDTDEAYDYTSVHDCPLARYLASQGAEDPRVSPSHWSPDRWVTNYDLDQTLDYLVRYDEDLEGDGDHHSYRDVYHLWTYGQLASRLENHLLFA